VTAPAVSAVVVSYNCADLLRAALASLLGQEVAGGLQVVVVDNASTDGSAAAAREAGAEVVALERNVGFAAANNVGARRARGELLLFANPDVEAPPGVVAELTEFLDKNPAAVAAGPKLVGREGRLQRFCARKAPAALNLLFLVSGLEESRWAGSPPAHRYYPGRYYERGPAPAEALAGAFMLVRRSSFEEVGGFDEGYFLYSEDLDLCRRLREAGGEIRYVPVGPVRHYTGGSRRTPSPVVVVESHRSAVRYARRWHGGLVAAAVRAVSKLSLWGRRLLFAAAGPLGERARRRARFYADVLAEYRRREGAAPAP
jgi:N-acetylglucosaminyl-diphospho-decaprenol L-rhamnosyltransferase